MAREIRGRQIARISIVEDDAEARAGYTYPIEDLQLTAIPEDGPLPPLAEFRETVAEHSDAVLCDHHLRTAEYASFNGAEAVAAWFSIGFPAVLCTKWEKAQIDEIRPFRSRIPVLVQPDQLAANPETLVTAIGDCIFELSGEHRPERRPWTTQVLVVEVEPNEVGHFFFVEIPGWQVDEVIRLRKQDVPPEVRSLLAPEFRCRATVNLGAESSDEIYFEDWHG